MKSQPGLESVSGWTGRILHGEFMLSPSDVPTQDPCP